MFGFGRKTQMPEEGEALPGRSTSVHLNDSHFVNGHSLKGPFPDGLAIAMFGMGCFWGAERRFWELSGVYSTAVGYAAGYTPNPSYEEVCSGMTGHNEVVKVVYDPSLISYQSLLEYFWEGHNPTQSMRQGNDVGTQYRSGIYTFDDQQKMLADQSREHYQHALQQVSSAPVSTEILPAPMFYYAEDYHQQYLAKNPSGYCGLGGTGVCYPK
ncbi:MAG: peptide-methionine (S)-S-oxide reductase MsrA [Candidatus Thiodiazotropha sp. (ex Ustalcina ferruginea)]|nr:peptide-methionine (S)-S-oxide reductase MsrA [Candidatus Thiodiazotropha sp. (ex Ustalcina ferruginea)]